MKRPERNQRLATAIRAALLSGALISGVAQAQFPAVMPLADLNGQNGFRIDGVAQGDFSGYAVSAAGDVNGDGMGDVFLSAPFADPLGNSAAGSSYVVFGAASHTSTLELGALNGSNGFRLDGVASQDQSGRALAAAGDVNDDGIDDLIIGARLADGGFNLEDAGRAYVVFGRSGVGFASSFNLGDLNGSDGFRLEGAAYNDQSGVTVAGAGDINGDGVADIAVGSIYAHRHTGSSYVVFGRTGGSAAFSSVLALSGLNGSNGFRLDGVVNNDVSGYSIAAAGDVNGDGFDDLLIGAPWADPVGRTNAGSSYVVFGHASSHVFASVMGLSELNGSNGFRIDGVSAEDISGGAVAAAGDVNHDGVDDLIIGARWSDPRGLFRAGTSYVVYGRTGAAAFSPVLELSQLQAGTGLVLEGESADDNSGCSVAAAGDVNGDGMDDLIVGAYRARTDDILVNAPGAAYLVFGGAGLQDIVTLDLNSLNGENGTRLDGVVGLGKTGGAVAGVGDVNGDQQSDVIVNATGARPGDHGNAGSSYVVFGSRARDLFADGFESP